MDKTQTFQLWLLETGIATLRQRYPASCVSIVEDSRELAVIQLDQFTITITNQGIVEVAAPTNSHRQGEQLAIEIEQLLSQAHLYKQGQASQ